MSIRRVVLTGTGLLLAFAATASAALATTVAGTNPQLRAPQKVSMIVLKSDRVVGGNVALAPSVPVRITFTNFSKDVHTFTMPGLRVNVFIPAARGRTPARATVTFTPRRLGAFAWRCEICPTGIHGRRHGMSGTLYVIIDPSVLP